MSEQKRKLMQMLAVAVANLQQLDNVLGAVQDLGRRHATYGVTSADYEPVGDALLWTLEQGLGPDFTPPVKEAWGTAYATLAGAMTAAAAATPDAA